ncbi:Aste57867_25319 [Aphanomyces stellatus]|uniref:Aste57867_25319 protein n=1 Tax=Aphanomyces stellatus TaxID=120398 RepID=A0A485LSS6_9STRA|nr:hypothetical protein As57867_025241 [Aphanomyces stellatus]VFU01944.1 Aste57867_25319 [Aphanomyces stellatus]
MSATNASVQSINWRTDTAFQGLSVHIPGRVFVSYNASLGAAATVSVTSDSAALLELISLSVATTPASSTFYHRDCDETIDLGFPNATYLAIRAKSDVDVLASGTLLVHITLGQPLAWVDTYAESILANGTLVNGADRRVVIASVASGNVHIDAAYPVHLQSLAVSTIGSGNVQFATPRLTTDNSLSLSAIGHGSVAVGADSVSALYLQTSIAGSGSVYLTGANGVSATNVHVDIAGGGNVNVYPQGSCGGSWVNVAGSGHANTGSLVCQDASVNTIGRGDVIVQALDTLKTSIIGSGSVEYFNATPTHLPKTDEGFSFFRTKAATHTDKNTYDTYTFAPTPEDAPLQVLVELNQTKYSHCMNYHAQQGPLGTALQPQLIRFSATANKMTLPLDVLGVLALVFVALVAFMTFKKAKKRTGYVALPK